MWLCTDWGMHGLQNSLASVIQTIAEQGLFVATIGMGFIAAILIILNE